MVTNETTNEILFTLEDCALCKFIELVTGFLPLPPKIISLKKPVKEILNLSPTKTFPILKSTDDYITGVLPIIKYLIKTSKDESDGVVLDSREILLGKNIKEESQIDTWTNYILISICPITTEIIGQLRGKKKYDKNILDMAINDLLSALNVVNNKLNLNTFLTSNTIQLADLMLVSVLFDCFNDVLTQDKLDNIPNVTRVFKFVSHMKKFVEIFGKYELCKEQKAPLPFVESKEEEEHTEEKKEKNKDKKNKKKKENKEEKQQQKEDEKKDKKEKKKKEKKKKEKKNKMKGKKKKKKKKRKKKKKIKRKIKKIKRIKEKKKKNKMEIYEIIK